MTDSLPPDWGEETLPDPPPLTEERLARIAKGLAHPTRIRILEQFKECQPRIAQDIVGECSLAQSTVSEHLRILREADVLFARRDGPRTWYCIRRSVLRQFIQGVEELTEQPLLAAYR